MSDDTTSCCTTTPDQPPERTNAPGQDALRYRIGTQPTFLRRMVEALPRTEVADDDGDLSRPLQALTTRATDDGTIALLDAWASALDVLTFYGERILNEGYLPTATQTRSLLELARAIGYQPSPGVAASAKVAFTIDDTAAAEVVTVPAGLPIMSVPGTDELPQTFETSAELEAHAEWNALGPVLTRPHPIEKGTTTVYLAGTSTRLAVGDPIVVVGSERGDADGGSERWDLRFVAALELDADGAYTLLTLDRHLGDRFTDPAAAAPVVLTFRARASLFGHNAPDVRVLQDTAPAALITGSGTSLRWKNWHLSEDEAVAVGGVDLDREYARVVKGSWICLQDRTTVELYRVTEAVPSARTDFTLAGKCTRVKVDSTEHLTDFKRRRTVVHIESEELPIAEAPFTDPVQGARVELDSLITEMPAGRTVIFVGTDADDSDGSEITEVATVRSCDTSSDGLRTVLVLEEELAYRYVRDGLIIHGNVADATHGATVSETLGSGDGAATHQSFTLKATPLTFVPASTASGGSTTLTVRVGGVAWTEVDSLHAQAAAAEVYVTRQDDSGATVIEFGDGIHGARLPSGTNNVTASYRKGLGLDGEVDAGQLSLLQQRPLGVRAVTNPAPASGADDPDDVEDTRANAPLGVLTLDRLVSVQDYEDFARAFAGIGKARAVELWDGKRGFVHVTVASASGEELADDSATLLSLQAAMASYADPAHVASAGGHETISFGVTLKLLRDAAYLADDVDEAVRAALVAAFSFSERQFGQAVTASEVISVVQGVAGVTAVDLDALFFATDAGASPRGVAQLPAARATWTGGTVSKAELLLVDEELITLREMEA